MWRRRTWIAGLVGLLLGGLPLSAGYAQLAGFGHVFQAAATGTGNGTAANVRGYSLVALQITTSGGPPTFTIAFEGSVDTATYVTLMCGAPDLSNWHAASSTATGVWRCNVAGLSSFRARISTFAGAGSVTVTGVILALFPAVLG